MRSLLTLVGAGWVVLVSGCGIAALDLRYTRTGTHQLVTTAGPKVTLDIEDAREKKVFFRTALGENDDAGKHGVLRLRRSPTAVLRDGFTEALQIAGCQVIPGSPGVLNVRIVRFLAIDRENNTNTIRSDIALDVSVVHAGAVVARKSIFETDTGKSGVFKAWQESIPPILNGSLSRAIEKAVWDPDILLAIERANGLSTTRDDILARLRTPPQPPTATASTPAPPVAAELSKPPVAGADRSTPPVSTHTPDKPSPPPIRNGRSPFRAQRVRGLGPPEVHIRNQSGKTITIRLTGPQTETFDVGPRDSATKKLQPGTYSYHASALGVVPSSGQETFNTDHRYTWTFTIVTYPSIPSIRRP